MGKNKKLNEVNMENFSSFIERRFNNKSLRIKLRNKINDILKIKLWIPSRSSYYLLLFAFIPLSLLAQIGTEAKFDSFFILDCLKGIPTINKDDSIYQNLISINSGIGAIAIGLSFFVAQSLFDSNNKNKSRILLYTSNFFPLLSFVTMIYIILLMGDLNYLIVLYIFLLGVYVIFSLGQTIEILIRKNKQESIEMQMLTDINRESFYKSLQIEIKRKASYIYINKLDNFFNEKYGKKITFDYFSFLFMKEIEFFNIDKSGVITNINIDKLEKLVSYLLNNINLKSNKLISDKTTKISEIESNKSYEPIINFNIFPYSEVSVDTNILGIHKESIPYLNVLQNNIRDSLEDILTVDKIESLVESKESISELKDKIISFINLKKNYSNIKSFLNVYLVLIDDYYKIKKEHEETLNEYESVTKSTLLNDSKSSVLDNVFNDLREINILIIKESELTVISIVLNILHKIIYRSIENFDTIGVKKLSYIPVLLYKRGFTDYDISILGGKHLINEAWRFINYFNNNFILSKFLVGNLVSAIFYKLSSITILTIQTLLIETIDKKDERSFNYYLEQFKKDFDYNEYFINVKYIEYQSSLKKVLEVKEESIFDLTSILLSEVFKESLEFNISSYNRISEHNPKNLLNLTNLYLRVISSENEFESVLAQWEYRNHEDGEIFTSDVYDIYDYTYLFQILNHIDLDKNIEEIIKYLPLSKVLSIKTSLSGDLNMKIDKIQNSESDFIKVGLNYDKVKIIKLHEILKRFNENYNEYEKSVVRNDPILHEKVDLFESGFIKNYNQTIGIKDVFRDIDLIKYVQINEDEFLDKQFGISIFFEKSAFIEDEKLQDVYWAGFEDAFDFGQTIKIGENNQFMKYINGKFKTVDISKLENTLIYLDSDDYIVISTNLCLEYIDFFDIQYVRNWDPRFKDLTKENKYESVEGYLISKNFKIPVYNIMYDSEQSEIILFRKSEMGSIIQYQKSNQQVLSNNSYFDINIIDTMSDDEIVGKYISNPPKWLKAIGSVEKQKEYLLEKVLIEIFERFEFKIENQELSTIFKKINIEDN